MRGGYWPNGAGRKVEGLTGFGGWRRAKALDEVTQLLNVLRGELSLVGPRPRPVAYLPLYSRREALGLRVRPGLCGLAQAEGLHAEGWDSRLASAAPYAPAVWAPRLAMPVTHLFLIAALPRQGTVAPPRPAPHAQAPDLRR